MGNKLFKRHILGTWNLYSVCKTDVCVLGHSLGGAPDPGHPSAVLVPQCADLEAPQGGPERLSAEGTTHLQNIHPDLSPFNNTRLWFSLSRLKYL